MRGRFLRAALGGVASLWMFAGAARADVLSEHHFAWWDTPAGVVVTSQAGPPPAEGTLLLLVDEWHLDQQQTADWYAGRPIPGLPDNPFQPANRSGLTAGSAIAPVRGAEAFVYRLTNVFYVNGDVDPFTNQPFSFDWERNGVNQISGINIRDTWGALAVAAPAPNSQFMFSSGILDLTARAVSAPPANQDWEFNTFAGPGNFEWDIQPDNGEGAFPPDPFPNPVVFGFAMPGKWQDDVSGGWVHSWSYPMGPSPVNVTPTVPGFSGPRPGPPTGPVSMAPDPVTIRLGDGFVVIDLLAGDATTGRYRFRIQGTSRFARSVHIDFDAPVPPVLSGPTLTRSYRVTHDELSATPNGLLFDFRPRSSFWRFEFEVILGALPTTAEIVAGFGRPGRTTRMLTDPVEVVFDP